MTDTIPQDPVHGQTITVPESMCWGTTNCIQIFAATDSSLGDEELIGWCEKAERCLTSSRHWAAYRVVTQERLQPGMCVRVLATVYDFDELMFLDGLGWIGTKKRMPGKTLIDKSLRVRTVHVLNSTESNWYYEIVDLEAIPTL